LLYEKEGNCLKKVSNVTKNPVVKPAIVENKQMIKEALVEYRNLLEQENKIKARKTELATVIKSFAEKNGSKTDTGSYYSETEDYVFGSHARTSINLNEEKAMDLLLEKGLYEQAISTKTYLDEAKIEQLLANGDITNDDLELMVDKKTTYAVDVKLKDKQEEMPEIQEQKLVEKKDKPKPLIRKAK
jgi:hypothetical protein